MRLRATALRWLFWLPLFLRSGNAYAQEWTDFHLKRIFGEVGLGLELWDEERGQGQFRIQQQEVIPRASLTLGTTGYFYHPRLLEFDLRGTAQYQRQWVFYEGPQPDLSTSNVLPEWEMRFRLFQEHPYWGEVYSQRREAWTRQSFFPTIRSTITETGLNVGAREWLIPSILHYHHYTFDSRGVSRQDEARDAFSIGGSGSTGRHSISYLAEFDAVELKHIQQAFDTSNVRVSTKHLLGDDRELTWQNRANVRNQVGDLNTEFTSASSTLFSRLTSNLDGNASLEFERSESNALATETLRWKGGLTHSLFDSLVSSGNLQTQKTSLGTGDIGLDRIGGGLDYRKETPIGSLGLRYGVEYYTQDQGDLQAQIPIFEESHIFTLGLPITLNNQAVDPTSVRITDISGLTLYTEGPDYILVPTGSLLRVEIPIGSLIVPGQTILVSYEFQPSPANSLGSITHSTGLDFTFGDIADFRLGYQTTEQDLRSGTDPGNLTDTVSTTADFQIHPGESTVGLHYRQYETMFAPYERRSVRYSTTRSIWSGSIARLQAENYRTEFEFDNQNEHGSSINAQLTSSLGLTSLLEFRGEWFKTDYRVDSGRGYSLEFAWKKRIRDLELAIRVRYLDEQFVQATDQEIGILSFSLTRRF